jgi:CubicO group peptidase (beta-lactamase class C family)
MVAKETKIMDQLQRSSPESQCISSGSIHAFIDAIEEANLELHSFMLLRHGLVVAEGWWAPFTSDTPHILFSLTKSFTSTAVGMAVQEGYFSINDPIISFFPEESPARVSKNLSAMQIRHLLTMSTGHLEDATEKMVRNQLGNWVQGFLRIPVKHAPGAPFVYNSAASHILSAIVQKSTGLPLAEYLKPRLFDPLKINGSLWDTDPFGINTGGWGLSLRTEDIARFGQLYLQNGSWEGKQILKDEWIAQATSKQVSNERENQPVDWCQGYGYQFWRCQHNAFRGDGAFGQFCIVFPEQDSVLAITAGVSDMQAVLDRVWDFILPGLQAQALPEDGFAHEKLANRLSNLVMRQPKGSATSYTANLILNQTYQFESNPTTLTTLRFEDEPDGYSVILRNESGEHRIRCGSNTWVKSATCLFPLSPTNSVFNPKNSYHIAGSYSWSTSDTLDIVIQYIETPFSYKLSLKFAEKQVSMQHGVNVSFGPTEFPPLTGFMN